MLARMWRKENFVPFWWECKVVQPLLETVWMSLKKLKIELLYETSLLGRYPKGIKTVP
jgi:hypothetical protein